MGDAADHRSAAAWWEVPTDAFATAGRDRLTPGRRYRQSARAAAARETRLRITAAFISCACERWFDEITLDEIAARAGVNVRTVIRQFGGKDGLIESFVQYPPPELVERLPQEAGDVDGYLERRLSLYEAMGDVLIRLLAQEHRHPLTAPLLKAGREGHAESAAAAFQPWLDRLPAAKRRIALDALVAASDVCAWKLLRREMRRGPSAAKAAMRLMLDGILAAI